MTSQESVMVAKVSFYCTEGLVRKGTTVRVGHPLLDGREDIFEPIHVKYDTRTVVVEQATAGPGEMRQLPVKRGPGRPRKNPEGS